MAVKIDRHGEKQDCDHAKGADALQEPVLFYALERQIEHRARPQSHPESEGKERPHVGIITFTRLRILLVEVDGDGDTGHDKQHHNC